MPIVDFAATAVDMAVVDSKVVDMVVADMVAAVGTEVAVIDYTAEIVDFAVRCFFWSR